MKIIIKSVSEKDIDFILINEFSTTKEILKLFQRTVNLELYEVTEIIHSLTDNVFGESDITVILSNNSIKHAILIENKINAVAMPEQSSRYLKRAQKQVANGLYDTFDIFITAPKKYLEINEEAQKYPNKLEYETLLQYFNGYQNKQFQVTLLTRAIEDRTIYIPATNLNITDFNEKYLDYCIEYFQELEVYEYRGPKGPTATWPGFRAPMKHVKITHKSYNGYVDLRFGGLGPHISKFKEIMLNYIDEDMSVIRTGKTANIRLNVPMVYFSEDFESQKDSVHLSLLAVKRLREFIDKITYDEEFITVKESLLKLYDQI